VLGRRVKAFDRMEAFRIHTRSSGRPLNIYR
jgi:hypothetical protein